MIDKKEWEKLYKWAYEYSKKITLSGNMEECWRIDIYIDENTYFFIDKNGNITVHKYFYNTTVDFTILKNRTPQQIKSIIKNLVDEANND